MPREFSNDPDWDWRRSQWQPTMLLHSGAQLADVPADGLAYLATPILEADGGPVLAADQAMEWVWQLGRVGVYAISPAMLMQARAEADRPKTDPLAALAYSDRVVVPPMPGWETSIEVERAVCAALAANKPVYLLAEQAGAM